MSRKLKERIGAGIGALACLLLYAGDRAGTFIMEAMIATAQQEEKPITVFVNPDNPVESMVNREIRWKLLLIALPFGLGFGAGGLAGFFLIGREAFGFKQTGGRVPWLKARTREALTQWVVALVWNGVSLPIALIAIPSLWAQGEWFPIILLAIFPLIGMLILWSALSSTVGALREGLFNAAAAR